MFARLYTISDRQCVYQGSTNQLVSFLDRLSLQGPSYTPASYIIEVACGEYGDNIRKQINSIDNGENDIRDGKLFPELKNTDGSNNGDLYERENLNMTVVNNPANSSNYKDNKNLMSENTFSNGTKESNIDGKDIERANVASALLNNAIPVNQPRCRNSELQQFFTILKQALPFSRGNWIMMCLRLFAHILVGTLIGALYFKIGDDGSKVPSNLNFLFFNMLFLVYTSMTITLMSFPLELPVLLKERFNRWYSLRSYYLATTISDMPFQAVFCIIYVTIVYIMTSQPPEPQRYGMFLLACLLVSFVAQSFGLVVGAAMNVQDAVFLAPVMSVLFMLFSGFFVSFDAIPTYLRWITYLSYIRYGFEGTVLATYDYERQKLECFTTYCHFRHPTKTLEDLGGRTIICTFHQISARLFEMFARLYTISDRQCVYQGSTNQLVSFLDRLSLQGPSYTPASYIIEVACGEYGDNIRKQINSIDNGENDIRDGKLFPELKNTDGSNNGDLYERENLNMTVVNNPANSSNYKDNKNLMSENTFSNGTKESNIDGKDIERANVASALLNNAIPVNQPRCRNSELQQFFTILKQALPFSRGNWIMMCLRLFAHILVGTLIGALYFKIGDDGSKVPSNLNFLFFNMLFLVYTSMTITLMSFPLELPVLLKERFNRWYSLRSYYLATTISDMPFQAVFCIIYVTIVYIMTSQPPEPQRYGMFLLACLLVSFVAQSFGLVVGAAMNVQDAVFLAPVMSVLFMLFSGFFVSFDAIPTYLRWITYLSYIRYGFEGTVLATYDYERQKLECFTTYCHFRHPTKTLEDLGMTNSSYTIDIVALVVIFFALRISAFLLVRWKIQSNR